MLDQDTVRWLRRLAGLAENPIIAWFHELEQVTKALDRFTGWTCTGLGCAIRCESPNLAENSSQFSFLGCGAAKPSHTPKKRMNLRIDSRCNKTTRSLVSESGGPVQAVPLRCKRAAGRDGLVLVQ
jgi:hypothetical protein